MRRSRSTLVLAVALFALVALAIPAAGAATVVPTALGRGQVRPYRIDPTGDGSEILGGFTRFHALQKSSPLADFGRLHWSSWSAREGRASGAAWVDDFRPDGAAGTFHASKVTIRVFRARHGFFTRLTIHIAGNRPVTLAAAARNGGWSEQP